MAGMGDRFPATDPGGNTRKGKSVSCHGLTRMNAEKCPVRVHARPSVAKTNAHPDVRESAPAEPAKTVASQQCAEESPGSTEQGAR